MPLPQLFAFFNFLSKNMMRPGGICPNFCEHLVLRVPGDVFLERGLI